MFFNNFDFISPPITLYYNNKIRLSSPLGGLLSILFFFSMMFILIYILVLESFPSKSSLLIYRNFEIDQSYNYFNESGLFHFIWIYNNKSTINNNIIKLNNIKKGIIRIYMTYLYDQYEYNSSNLKDKDHWVYDTCNDYSNKDDLVYDYSFSSCIKYYYNSIHKRYYSIHDNLNFKWPYIRENITDIENKACFATFVEKCSNNSILNDIFGECYSDEKINEYLSTFNNIFISFINKKIEINNKRNIIETYSHKLYDKIINKFKYFYTHELKFTPFNYEEKENIIRKRIKYNSFMFSGERETKIYNEENKNLLLVYVFRFKNYIEEYRKQNNYLINCFHVLGGMIFLIYFIFYILNCFINKRIEVRNFQKFLNDKRGNIIQRHINYEKNKIYSLKSNIYTNISNDGNDQSFKSTYFGNFIKNDISNIYNSNNNSKINENNYTINIEKGNEKDFGKKTDNIIVINNGTFMNNEKTSSNNKFKNSIEKINTLKVDKNLKGLEFIENYNKSYTYTKKKEENKQNFFPTFANKESNVINFSSYTKNKLKDDTSEKNEAVDFGSKQKIVDTSSLSLLNYVNKSKNVYLDNSNYNLVQKKEIPSLNFESLSPKNKSNKMHKKKYSLPKENISSHNNYHNENNKIIPYGENKDRNKLKEKYYNMKYRPSFENLRRERRKSHQARNTFRDKENNDKKSSKNKNNLMTGIFQIPINNKKERHLSLFSRNSNLWNNNNKTFNLYPWDNNSQNNLSKNLIQHYKKIHPLHKFMSKNIDKEKISQYSDFNSKYLKKDLKNSFKFEHSFKQSNKLKKIVQKINCTPMIFWNYLCLCREKESNGINILNRFRRKLLSEEYLYILHLNMFIFKQKLGCKTHLDKINLLDELYNDY